MNKVIRLLYIFIIPFSVNAQNSLSGNIVEIKTKEKLVGASIYLPELKKGTTSNQVGFFEIKDLPKGKFLVEVKFISYETIVLSIDISGNVVHDFNLKENIAELHEVVTTGIGRSTEIKLNPVVIKSIDNLYLKQNTATNLIDALKSIPGISQISTGAAISKPIIRGLGYNRIITLNNGVRQEGQQWGDEHGIELDEFNVDRIEIVKGPGSLIYGSDGIAGVINFISANSLPENEIKTSFVSNYQTNNNLFATSISNMGSLKNFQWSARLTRKDAGNFSNKLDGKVFNSMFNEFDMNLSLGVNRKWGYSQLSISSFNQKIALPEGERDSTGAFVKQFVDPSGILQTLKVTNKDLNSYTINFPFQKITHQKIVSNTFYVFDKGSFNLDIAFQQNLRREYSNLLSPSETALYFDLKTFNYALKYNFQKWKGWESSTGLNGMMQWNINKGVEFLIPEYFQKDLGYFLTSEKSLNAKLRLSIGARIDNRSISIQQLRLDQNGVPISIDTGINSIKFSSLVNQYNSFSGAAGITYQPNKISNFKFNFSRGFRAPNISEISSNGKHEGSFRYEYGNNNLKAEYNHQIDLAYYFNSDHLNIEISPYVNFIQNYIYSEKLLGLNGGDSIPDISDPTPAYKFTQGNARLWGAELLIDLHPHPIDWLHIENGFSFVNALQFNQSDSTKYLPFIPAPHYRLELRAQFKNVNKILKNSYLKASMDSYFNQNRVYAAYGTESKSVGYTLFGLGLGSDLNLFKNSKRLLSCYLSIDNLTNVAYQNHLSRLRTAPTNFATGNTGIYNMGRNLSFKLYLTI